MPASLKDKRLGETRRQKCGLEATIVEYINGHDMTIQFPDGAKNEHRTYSQFKKGEIGHPTIKTKPKRKTSNRVGETRMQNCGLEATIVIYENALDITVEFPDGTTVANKPYYAFKNGKIQPVKGIQPKLNRIGETKMMRCGFPATIIGYRNAMHIDVQFPDKTKVTDRTYGEFKKGTIQNPKLNTKQKYRTLVQNCGLRATITKYRAYNDMDIVFEDGTISLNKSYTAFERGNVGHPTIYRRFYGKTGFGKIHPDSKSKIYHTRIFGIAHKDLSDNTCYYAHCPICGTHAIWTFETIRNHKCNQELVQERDALIQELTANTEENIA